MEDFDLRYEITAIEQIAPGTPDRFGSGWRTRRAQALLIEVRRRYAALATKLDRSPGDVPGAALQAWREAGFTIPETHDPWAWTGAAAKRILGRERQAELLLTAPGSRNVRAAATTAIPARFDPTDPVNASVCEAAADAPSAEEPALNLAAGYLVDAGLNETAAWSLLDRLSAVVLGHDFEARDGRPTGVTGRRSAVTSLQRERHRVAMEAAIDPDLVGQVTKLVFGSRERGGLLALRAEGASGQDLRHYANRFAGKTATGKKTPTRS